MKTLRLYEGKDAPWRDNTTGKIYLVKSPLVHLLNPYTIVAQWALQVKSKMTHICSWVERDGVVDFSPMTICGANSAKRPLDAQVVKGPVRISCKRCVTIALLALARKGELPGCQG
jgi:hypothetical protein